MLDRHTGDEALSPAGSVAIGVLILGVAFAIGRYALRQRARDRAAKDGKEIGSLDELFTREYKGEPKHGFADLWDFQFKPEAWPAWIMFASMLTLGGAAVVIVGLIRIVT